MSSIIINTLETGDEVLVTENTSVKRVESTASQVEPNVDLKDKTLFQEKMRDILSCRICCEMKRCPMYQCKHGHLMCAGCFNDIVAESRLQNEIACCPTCQATITKDFCFRNVAVEKTISELPMACPHCSLLFSPENFKYHEVVACRNRPAVCSNAIIGCSWKGTTSTKQEHENNCKQVSCSGYEILEALTEMDKIRQKEENMYNKIIELLSVEKITYIGITITLTVLVIISLILCVIL